VGILRAISRPTSFGIRLGLVLGVLIWATGLPLSAAQAAQLKSVQSGTEVFTGRPPYTVRLETPLTNLAAAFLVFSNRQDSDDSRDWQIVGQIMDPSTLRFDRSWSNLPTHNLQWYVAEFNSGVSVQRGVATLMSYEGALDLTISAVDRSKSFVILNQSISQPTTQPSHHTRAYLSTSTTLSLRRHPGSATANVAWQVMQYEGASVQTNIVSLPANVASVNATVTAVDTSKSWLHYTYEVSPPGPGISNDASHRMVRGTIAGPTTLTFDRGASRTDTEVTIVYYLVEFTDGTVVRHGKADFTRDQTALTVNIPAVSPAESIAMGGWTGKGGMSPYSRDPNIGPALFTVKLTNSTSVDIVRAVSGSATGGVGWSVVDFNASATAVELDWFRAFRQGDQVRLEWQTGREVDNLGFHIHREVDGKRERITESIIAGSALLTGPGAVLSAGQSYAFRDQAPPSGDVTYWLEDLDLDGTTQLHGPVRPVSIVRSGSIVAVTAPLLLENLAPPLSGSASGRPLPLFSSGSPVRTGPPAPLPVQWELAGQPAVKIAIARDGWYRIRRADLAGADPKLLATDPRRLRLLVEGREQAIRVVGEEDGRFDPEDAIEFFGRGADTLWTDRRVYWLVAGSTPGRRMAKQAGARTGRLLDHLPMTVERRDRSLYFAALKNGPAPNFFGPLVTQAGVEPTLDVHHLLPSVGAAVELELRLQGVTSGEHRVSVHLNDHFLGQVELRGQEAAFGRFTVRADQVTEGPNTVKLVAEAGEKDVTAVDFLRLRYPHGLEADGGQVAAEMTAGSTLRLARTGGRTQAFDVSHADSPVELALAEDPKGSDGAVWLITAPGERGERRAILVVNDDGVRTPAALEPNRISSWHGQENVGELIMMGPRAFLEGAEALRVARERQGWKVALVDVEDVYDEFGFGQKGPEAIRRFLRHAQEHWRKKPEAVLLVGDGSLDPRNHLGLGGKDVIPAPTIAAQHLETASDDWYVDFDEDGLPDLPIGRLPVRTVAEARWVAARIAGYVPREGSTSEDRVVLVADADPRYDFAGLSRGLREALGDGTPVVEVFRGELDENLTRRRLWEAFEFGPRLVNYLGHGSTGTWSGGLLDARSVATLRTRTSPLVVSMTCLNGFFHDVYSTSLAEALLNANHNANHDGALAVIASSGLTTVVGQTAFNRELVRQVVREGQPLGVALQRAKAATLDPDVRRTFMLFGDPTTTLVQPSVRNAAKVSLPGACRIGGGSAGPGVFATIALGLWLLLVARQSPPKLLSLRNMD
jgi:hypothetical protein